MAETPIRFGILGCARIARKISRAIKLVPNAATLYAIGSRSLDKASRFAADNGFPPEAKIYGSYEAVLDDVDVDAVYLPLPTSLHLHWAVLAAQKKKHLLLEKPVALSAAEFDKIVEACESNGVQFMDCTMWMHHPRTAQMAAFLIDAQRLGKLNTIHSTFTYGVDPDFFKTNIRVKPDLDALGALGDAGWYCVRAILWATNYELPKTATALREPVFNEAGVILSCEASLHWEDGKVATFHCSFLSDMRMDLIAIGTKGSLHAHDYVIPYQEKEASFTTGSKCSFAEIFTEWIPQPSTHVVNTDLPQDAIMVGEFARLVGAIKFNNMKPDKKWPIISKKTQLVIDAVKASIEKGFEPVEIEG